MGSMKVNRLRYWSQPPNYYNSISDLQCESIMIEDGGMVTNVIAINQYRGGESERLELDYDSVSILHETLGQWLSSNKVGQKDRA